MKKIIGILAVLLLVPMVSANNETNTTNSTYIDIMMSPGSSQIINCSTNCSAEYNMTCSDAGQRCYINRTLAPNETYHFDQGACNVTVKCPAEAAFTGVVEFPGVVRIDKNNETFRVFYNVFDWKGNPYMNRTWDVGKLDVISIETDVSFVCPAEINTEINYQTCSKYFDQYLEIDDPLLMAMVTGQNKAIDELIECRSELSTKSELAEVRWGDIQRERTDKENYLVQIGNLTNQKNDLTTKMSKMELTMVPVMWMYVSILLFVILVGWIVIRVLGIEPGW